MRSTPLNGADSPGNNSCKNFATCPEAGTVTDAVRPVLTPARVVNSRLTKAEVDEVFVIAMPLSMEPFAVAAPLASTYIRKFVAVGCPATDAAVTVTPLLVSENSVKPDGEFEPVLGVTRTEPTWVADPTPAVSNFTDACAGIA